LVDEHAAREAGLASLSATALQAYASGMVGPPDSEDQLFEQGFARLEEIRVGIEQGPFSERHLFRVGMPEKHLQLWLASKLRDTPNRHFTVERESEVDDDKRTDVQIACRHGTACIEIKPLDAKRSYSANSLVNTLRHQLVDQYLKGFNSAHGVLLLLRLDDKAWDLPDRPCQPFGALVDWLQSQADQIRSDLPHVRALQVIGIDCFEPQKL
jgi:hypothetical protein